MKLPLLNIDGTKSSSIEISDKLINLKVNHKLIGNLIIQNQELLKLNKEIKLEVRRKK